MLTPLEHSQDRFGLLVGAIGAVLVHALFLLVLLPPLLPTAEELEALDLLVAQREKKPPIEREDLQQELRVVLRTVEFEERVIPPEEEEPPKPEEEEKPEEVIRFDRKVVEQVTNEEKPVDAKFVSQQANKTEQETRATETTYKDVIPSNDPLPEEVADAASPDPDIERSDEEEDPAPTEEAPEELAMLDPRKEARDPSREEQLQEQDPRETKEESPREPQVETPTEQDRPPGEEGLFRPKTEPQTTPRDQGEDAPRKQVDPKKLFGRPSIADYEEVFGDEPAKPRENARGKKRRRMFTDLAEKQRRLKGSLENMITEIQPGNHTSVNADRAVYVGYINALHRRIHERWANDYLLSLDFNYPPSSPLQNPNLNTTLEFVIEAKSGKFEAVNVVQSSGELLFDSEAINVAWEIGERPNPPPQIISPNGRVYVHWNFWRDGRQCGVQTASIYLLNADAEGKLRKEQTAMPQ